MPASVTPWMEEAAPGEDELEAAFAHDGLSPSRWSNGPGDRYGWHSHPYHKVLFCSRGGMVFHTRDGDITLRQGDRLDLEPGTEHAATVGPDGVVCLEAARPA
jgi:quercetin dioxygenase-like cupin family protein